MQSRKSLLRGRLSCALALWMALACGAVAHVVPPEQFHPVVESYRRMAFLLNLNPVLWNEVKSDSATIAVGLETISRDRANVYRAAVETAVAKYSKLS